MSPVERTLSTYNKNPVTSHKETRYRRAHRAKSSQPRAKNYKLPCCLDTRRTHRVDVNMKASEFKAIRAENSS